MSITFNWSISKTQVLPVQDGIANVVTKAEWFVNAVDADSNMTSSSSGTCSFSLGDTFTPFEDLTEQQVLDWCFAPKIVRQIDSQNNVVATVKHLKVDTETQLTEQIARQLTQKQTEPTLPWEQIPA